MKVPPGNWLAPPGSSSSSSGSNEAAEASDGKGRFRRLSERAGRNETIELVGNKNDQRPPLADYRPLKTGWQRNSELSEPEVELRGKIGLVLILLVILLLVLLSVFPQFIPLAVLRTFGIPLMISV